jgi:PD-(D/E)XK nuclease superfamily
MAKTKKSVLEPTEIIKQVPKIRASERVAFQRCQAAWWWGSREGLVSKARPSDPLWFGTGIHLALARWYCGPGLTRGPEPAETWDAYAQEMEMAYVRTDDPDDETVDKYVNARELGIVMMEGYRRLYGRDETWSVVSPERTFKLRIPWPANAKNFWDAASVDPSLIMAELVGTYDVVYMDTETNRYWLGEHKTAKAIMVKHLAMDNQAGTYWATATAELIRAGLIPEGEVLAGIMYNFMRKALPDARPADAEGYKTNKPLKADYIEALKAIGIVEGTDGRGKVVPIEKSVMETLESMATLAGIIVLGSRSKVQPPPLFLRHEVHRTSAERRTQLLRAQQDALQMELLREGLLIPTKSNTRDCNWCQFYDMCELQERGGDWESLRDIAYRVQDPYADHRKSTDE